MPCGWHRRVNCFPQPCPRTHNFESESKMLNLSSNSSTGAYIRFMPSLSAWLNASGEQFTFGKVVMDVDNIKTGWLLLGAGMREWIVDDVVGRKGAQPTADHKRGFAVNFYNKELGLVEWCANGVGTNKGLETIYNKVIAAQAANPGKLPVIEYTGCTPTKIGAGSTKIPNFELKSWVARPAAMAEGAEPAAPAAVAPAPAVKAAPAPAPAPAEDEEMFQ